MSLAPRSSQAQQSNTTVAMAYVHDNEVWLAGADGLPLVNVGPSFEGQAGRLFWTQDGRILYIIRGNELFQTFADGGAAVKLPGTYSLTITLDYNDQVLYYLESNNPQDTEVENFITLPLRETNIGLMSEGSGRLVGYVGRYPRGTNNLMLVGAALRYAQDGGLLGSGRPRLVPTYGTTIFYSCCFPEPGMDGLNIATGQSINYTGAETLILGGSDINKTLSRLAGPSSNGGVLVVDLIAGGSRRFPVDVGTVERVAWGYGDRYLYLAVRQPARTPLTLDPDVTTDLDLQSAYMTIWRLDLVTNNSTQLAQLGDFYGISSMGVTEDYIFATVVESNFRTVADLNSGLLPGDMRGDAPLLRGEYLPNAILYRISLDGGEAISILNDAWGVTIRPQP